MSKESILQSIKANKPTYLPLPDIDERAFHEEVDLLALFSEKMKFVGGRVMEISESDIDRVLKKLFPEAIHISSNSQKCSLGNVYITPNTDPHDLNNLDVAIIEGELGVAENAAVWVSENQSLIRVLPFITNNLVVILAKDQLYLHMLQAYAAIAQRERGFGLFISGPSKTADIEQSLVIGAHGPVSMTVLLV